MSISDQTLKVKNQSVFKEKFDSQILFVQFSPYEWTYDILCIAFEKKICIAQVKFEDEYEFKILGEFNHEVQCTGIALSPQTHVNYIPKVLQFCTAGNDYKIRFFKSDLSEDNKCLVLKGHESYINDISFESENSLLASVSDDQTARLWNLNECNCCAVFYLTSPGISVCWHNDDPSKLMVSEKNGVIRFYNVHSQLAILSLESSCSISSSHWNPADSSLVGAFQRGELFLWDLTRPSRPIHTKLIHGEGGGHMRFSPLGNLVATVNNLSGSVKITQLENGHNKLTASVMLPSNVSWHLQMPIICVGDDRTLCFWKIECKS